MEKQNSENTKKKTILTFIIGVLVGGILTASVFLIFKPSNSRKMPDFSSISTNGEGFDFSQRRSRNNSTEEENDDSTKVEEKQDENQG